MSWICFHDFCECLPENHIKNTWKILCLPLYLHVLTCVCHWKKKASCSILANLGRMALVFSCHGFNEVVSDTIDGSIWCKNVSTPVLWKMTWFTTFFQQQVRKRTSLDNSSMTPKFVQRVRTGFQVSHGWRSDLLEHHTDLIRSCNVMYSVPCHPCLGHHRTWWITHTVYPLVIWHSHGKQIIYRWFTPITHGDFPQLC